MTSNREYKYDETRSTKKTPSLPIKNIATYASAVNKKTLSIVESGTTGYFLHIQSECIDKRPTVDELRVKLPDGGTITATHTALLNLPQLPMRARRAHIFPDIKHSLISINMLCEEGYMAIFDENNVYIVKDSEVMLHGYKDPVTRLYMVNITERTDTIRPKLNIKHLKNLGGVQNFSNNAYDIKKKRDLIKYYHK